MVCSVGIETRVVVRGLGSQFWKATVSFFKKGADLAWEAESSLPYLQ
jgi:hypothetical protein